MTAESIEQKEFKLGDNVIIKCYNGEHTAIITKVYPNYIGGETWYQLYYEDVCIMIKPSIKSINRLFANYEDIRLAPEITMVLRKGA